VNITYTFSSGALSAGSHTITCRVKDSLLRVTGSDSILLLVEQKDDGGGSGGGDDDLVTQCNALASITVSVDDPTYSEYGGGTCSNCATKIRVKYVGPEDINGVRMLYKQPTVSYGPWLWKGMGPLPDVYEVALGVGTGCCDDRDECDTNDITLIGAVYYDSTCDVFLDDPESTTLPLLNIDQPCRDYTR
jgi:hypothetical protein